MIIACPNCKKKFEIDQKLIPSEGRMLQCGSCDHQWFFKIDDPEKKTVNEEILTSEKVEKKEIDSIGSSSNDKTQNSQNEISSETYNENNIEQKPKRSYNFLNIVQ